MMEPTAYQASQTSHCLDDNIINSFVEGILSAEEAKQIHLHLAECEKCQELVQAVWKAARAVDIAGEPGEVLADTYQLIHPIGSGGVGTVYAAEHLRLQCKVAIKLLNRQLGKDQKLAERFKREAQICRALRSPHIVEVLDFNLTADGTPYIVMEFLTGEDLAQKLELDGPLDLPTSVEIMRQICLALACAHAQGVVHRDLKPSNIYLCDTDDGSVSVKVLDFGISKTLGGMAPLTVSSEVFGTPAYMSPEMVGARHDLIDQKADLFSLGAIAYETLIGEKAFPGTTIPEILYKVAHEDPKVPHLIRKDVPKDLSDLILSLLSKDIKKRPDNATSVEQRLTQLSTIPDLGSRLAKLPLTKKQWVYKSFLFTLLGLIIAGVLWWQTRAISKKNISTSPTVNKPIELTTKRIPIPLQQPPEPKIENNSQFEKSKKQIQPNDKRNKKQLDTDPLL